jgi:ADP-ribosylglycohydrolase
MLIEIAIGDAYGAGFEYVDPKVVAEFNDGRRYLKHPSHNLAPGQYTDDTQMSIAIAECLTDMSIWDRLGVAQKFVEVFARDPRDGYARGFQGVLEDIVKTVPRERWGGELLERVSKHGLSTKNGAAMRAMPIGLHPDLTTCVTMAMQQSMITHRGSAIDAGVASALAVHYATWVSGGSAKGLGAWLDERFSESHQFAVPWSGPVRGKDNDNLGIDTVRAAVTAVESSASVLEVLTKSIAYTGDVDTVAAIAMGIASVCELEYDLPDYLLTALERGGKYGVQYLHDLDEKLLKRTAGELLAMRRPN